MTTLKLADVKPVPVRGRKEERIEQFRKRVVSVEDRRQFTVQEPSNLEFLRMRIPHDEAAIYHRNYMEYLECCWANHYGIMITPDILWYTLVSELASLVKGEPETYRHLFTTSPDKVDISISTGDPVEISLGDLVDEMEGQVPTDVEKFMPDFSTTTESSTHACRAAFCDMCSPFYDYMMYLCGFPAINVHGDVDCWKILDSKWSNLRKLFPKVGEWSERVQSTLGMCVAEREKQGWWSNMFKVEKCGSGSDTVVSGWFADLFKTKPRVMKPHNFAPHVAKVDYKELTANRNFVMHDGLFWSRQEGEFMLPAFGYMIHEKV